MLSRKLDHVDSREALNVMVQQLTGYIMQFRNVVVVCIVKKYFTAISSYGSLS